MEELWKRVLADASVQNVESARGFVDSTSAFVMSMAVGVEAMQATPQSDANASEPTHGFTTR
ncbi:hypothetical protein [Variovorax rhizosphaerae]|uniref:Uncharacterized protein n=1 Tax=Variovorax rhizosphaerae TaxID=1836200 RepID=A0ABU8WP81_9BURK